MKKPLRHRLGKSIFLAAATIAAAVVAHAWGPDIKATTEAQYDSWGNQAKNRVVAQSTSTVVLISSTPANAAIGGLGDFRARVIENAGNVTLVLYGNATDFTIYQSSAGIHLLSDTTSSLNRYVWYGQGPIYGIWNSTGTNSGGASVTEFYYKNR